MTTHLLRKLVMLGAFADNGKPYFLGGDVTEADGYRIHTFTTDGTLEIVNGGYVEVVVVGCGGRGGNGSSVYPGPFRGGGGGGGGVVHRPAYNLQQTVNIKIGIPADKDTTFGTLLTALGGGGGGGGSYSGGTGDDGGCGGGNGQAYYDNPVKRAGTGLQPGSEWGGYGSNGQRSSTGGKGGSANFTCPITGTVYSSGGRPGISSPWVGEFYGDGGDGGYGVNGVVGKQGIVLVRYEI